MSHRYILLIIITLSLATACGSKAQAINKIDSVLIDSPKKEFISPISFDNSIVEIINIGPDGRPDANSNKATFENYATFKTDTFVNKVYLNHSTFDSIAIFTDCYFQKDLNFQNARFDSSVDFTGSRFDGHVNFSGSYFLRSLNLSDVIFQTELNLSALKLSAGSRFECYNTTLPDLIDFSYNFSLPIEMNFATANFNWKQTIKLHYINLMNTDIPKIKMDYKHFKLLFYNYYIVDSNFVFGKGTLTVKSGHHESSAYNLADSNLVSELLNNDYVKKYLVEVFPSCKYYSDDGVWGPQLALFFPRTPNLNIDVVKIYLQKCINSRGFLKSLADEDKNCIYEKVLNNFQNEGQNKSYQALDIEYKDVQNGIFYLPHLWNCYGYHKEWVFWWMALFLTLFTTISFFNLSYLNGVEDGTGDAIYPVDNIPKLIPLRQTLHPFSLHKLIRRIWYSFLYSASIFFLFSMDSDKINFKKPAIVYIAIIYMAGILCLAYAANFVLQK